jgi:hypothetical protein
MPGRKPAALKSFLYLTNRNISLGLDFHLPNAQAKLRAEGTLLTEENIKA